ncbi:MAG: glycosyltransferase family 39 protein [Candidatus Saccharibacteria bacterium]
MIKKILQKFRTPRGMTATDWVILAAGLTVFAIISLWTITKSSIWFDEAFGAYLIHFNFFDVAKYTAGDVHPPMYYWLLKSWSLLFGNSELALRSMSVLFAGIAISFGYALVHRLFGKKAARLSLLFMILAPMLVRYSQEMRMYALAAAISLAATYVLTYAITTKKRLPWVIYGVLVSLGMWTHYFTAIVWLSHWLWRAYVVRQSLGKKAKGFVKAFFSREWVLAHVVAVGLFLPWLPSLVYQVTNVQVNGFWIPSVTPTTVPNFLTNVLYYQDQDAVHGWAALIFLVIFVTIITLTALIFRTLNSKQRESYLLIITLAVMPVILLFILSMPPLRPSFIDRYLLPSTVGISLLMGVTLALSSKILRPRWQFLIGAIIVGSMIFGITNVYHFGNYNKNTHTSNNTRQTIEVLTAKSSGEEPIIAATPWLFYEAVFYSTPAHPVYFINANTQYVFGSLNMLRDNDQHKIKDLAAFANNHHQIWYIGYTGEENLTAPDSSWKQLQNLRVDDSITGKPAYQAIEYQTN